MKKRTGSCGSATIDLEGGHLEETDKKNESMMELEAYVKDESVAHLRLQLGCTEGQVVESQMAHD